MSEELIVLMSEDGLEIGAAPKLPSHHAETPLHKAFSCYIFDRRGRLLVTQRAKSKKVWPGVWTNSVCGHPMPGESYEEAIIRRASHELGMAIKSIKSLLPHYRYKTTPYNGIIENEICPVFMASAESMPNINPEEVEDIKWMGWQEFLDDISSDMDKYSFWCKQQVEQLKSHNLVIELVNKN